MRKKFLLAFLVFLPLSFALYHQSLFNGFHTDDYTDLINRKDVHDLRYIPQVLMNTNPSSEGFVKVYRPLSVIFRTVLYHFFHQNAFYYHAVNIILWAVYCALIFTALFWLTKEKFLSSLTALLFCFHPMHTMAINVATAHEVMLFGIFCLLSVLFFLKYFEGSKNIFWFAASLISFVLALLTQEVAITFPLFLTAALFTVKKLDIKSSLKYSSLYFLAAVIFVCFRLSASRSLTGGLLEHLDPNQDIYNYDFRHGILGLIWWYVTRLIVPQDIVFLWAIPQGVSPSWVEFGGGFCVILSLIVFAIASGKSISGLAAFWFLSGFLPLIFISFVYFSAVGLVVEPHWFFFSSVGFFVLAAQGILFVYDRIRKLTAIVILIFFLGYWGWWTNTYNHFWKDQKIYLYYWLRVMPQNPYANRNLANAYLRDGNFRMAIFNFEEALRYLKHPLVYEELGDAYSQSGDLFSAKENYRKAIEIRPDRAALHNKIGIINLKENNTEAAKDDFRKAIEADEWLSAPWINLGDIYIKERDFAEAVLCYEKALKIDPLNDERVTLEAKLSALYFRMRENDKSFEIMDKAVKRVNIPSTYITFAYQFDRLGARGLAYQILEQGIKGFPNDKEGYLLYGVFLANDKKYDMAIGAWQKGSEIDPKDERFLNNIKEAQRLMGIEKQ